MAYDLQEKVLNGLASHVVAPADGLDPHTVAHQVLGRRYYGTVTVIDDGPDTLVALQVGNSYGPPSTGRTWGCSRMLLIRHA